MRHLLNRHAGSLGVGLGLGGWGSAHALSKRRPSGHGNNGQHCGKCGKSHERGNCPAYGKTCNKSQGINHFKAICHSKVTARTGQTPHRSKKSQPHRHSSTGATRAKAKEVATINIRRRRPQRSRQSRKRMQWRWKTRSHQKQQLHLVARERITVMYQRQSYQDRRRKVRTTGFLALQCIVKCLKAPMLRVSPWRGCILTLTQTIGLKSLQISPSGCQVKLAPWWWRLKLILGRSLAAFLCINSRPCK